MVMFDGVNDAAPRRHQQDLRHFDLILWMLVRDWSDNEREVRREPSFIEGGNMLRVSTRFGLWLCAGLAAIAEAAQTERLIFLSTQLRPIEEAQKMRNLVLKDFSREVDYITDLPQRFPMRIEAERQTGMHTTNVVSALHGELQLLVPLDAHATAQGAARAHGRSQRIPAAANGHRRSEPLTADRILVVGETGKYSPSANIFRIAPDNGP
jgi:hypothetical protein